MEPLWTYKEVAAFFRCCVKHVRDAFVKTGLLRVIHDGRNVRFDPADVRALAVKLKGGALCG